MSKLLFRWRKAIFALPVFVGLVFLGSVASIGPFGLKVFEHKAAVVASPRAAHHKKGEVALDGNNALLKKISFDAVTRRDIPTVVETTGQLQVNANAITRVNSPTAGRILSLTVSVGDTVIKGQTVAEVTSQEVSSLIADFFKQETEIESELSIDLEKIEFTKSQTQLELELCTTEFNRAKVLFEEKIGSQRDVECKQTELNKLVNQVAALSARLASKKNIAREKKERARAGLTLKLSALGIPPSTIKALMSGREPVQSIPLISNQGGIVLERTVNVGELVQPSQSLLVIDDIDTLWLMADVYEQDIRHVRVGQQIEFRVDSYSTEVYKGKLDHVAGAIDPETRTLAVRAVIPNTQMKLKPKMFARMRILVGNNSSLSIPKKAIQEAGSFKVVYVPAGKGCFRERIVEVDEEVGDWAVIKSGLKEGERVVVEESLALRSLSLKSWN